MVHFSFYFLNYIFFLYYLNIFCMFVSARMYSYACTREVRTTFRSSFSSFYHVDSRNFELRCKHLVAGIFTH